MTSESRFDLTPHLPAGGREFLPESEDRAAWSRLHAFRLTMHRDLEPDDTPEPDAVAEIALRRPEPFSETRHLVLERADEVLTSLRLSAVRPGSPEYESDRHHVWADIQVLPAHRRRGLASGWLPAVAAFAESRGAGLVSFDSDHQAGHAFAEHVGAEARMRSWQSRLWLERARWQRIREWAAIDPGGRRLEKYEPFPPEPIWPDYARDYTELGRHVPREGMEMGDWILTPERMRVHRDRLAAQGRTLHVLAAWDAEGMCAITEMIAHAHDQQALDQELTAVHPRVRRRGLARLLKAQLLLELRERYPQARFVRTYNASSNDAMWGINAAMGFEHYRLDVGYQLPLDRLRQHLAGA